MTDNAIRHYFQDFPTWCALKNITAPDEDSVADWAASLVDDNFVSEEEAAELLAAAKDDASLYALPDVGGEGKGAEDSGAEGKGESLTPSSNDAPKGDSPAGESAAALGEAPMPTVRKAVEEFTAKVSAAVKAFYDSNSVMVEDCEGDILALNTAVANMNSCMESARQCLVAMKESLGYTAKDEDIMTAISLLGDAIKELASDDEGDLGEEGAGAPADSLSSEVSAIYADEPTPPESVENPASPEEAPAAV